MKIEFRIVITAVLFLAMIISGVVLSKTGRPLNNLLFTIHKLVVIAAIIFMIYTVYLLQKNLELHSLELILIITTGLLLLITFVTGALLSFEKLVSEALQVIHKVTPFVTLVALAITVCYLKIAPGD